MRSSLDHHVVPVKDCKSHRPPVACTLHSLPEKTTQILNDHWYVLVSFPGPCLPNRWELGNETNRLQWNHSNINTLRNVSWLTRCPHFLQLKLHSITGHLGGMLPCQSSQPSPQQEWQILNYLCLVSGKAAGLRHTIGYISGAHTIVKLQLVWTS